MNPVWLTAYEEILPYRLLFGFSFFVTLGAIDYVRHRSDARRAKEYLFLGFTMVAAVLYAVVHDHITATISRAYFLNGKGLVDDPRPFRIAVTLLAVRASYGVGLVAGVALLIANNPVRRRRQLPYPEMCRLAMVPVVFAAAAAVVGAVVFSLDRVGLRDVAPELFVDRVSVTRFLIVWGAHSGSYLGGCAGTVIAVVRLRRRRRTLDFSSPGTSLASHFA